MENPGEFSYQIDFSLLNFKAIRVGNIIVDFSVRH